MDKPKRMFRVKSPIDLYVPFTKGLLTESQQKEWEEFKKDEVKGKSDEEIRYLRRDVESTRLTRWATARGMGADPIQNKMQKGEQVDIPSNYTIQNKFLLPKGESIVSEAIRNELRMFDKKAIVQKLKLGQSKAETHYEGFLEWEELSEEETSELDIKKKK